MNEQFPTEDGYRIVHCDHFEFKRDEGDSDSHIRIIVPNEYDHCVIGLQPANAKVLTFP